MKSSTTAVIAGLPPRRSYRLADLAGAIGADEHAARTSARTMPLSAAAGVFFMRLTLRMGCGPRPAALAARTHGVMPRMRPHPNGHGLRRHADESSSTLVPRAHGDRDRPAVERCWRARPRHLVRAAVR